MVGLTDACGFKVAHSLVRRICCQPLNSNGLNSTFLTLPVPGGPWHSVITVCVGGCVGVCVGGWVGGQAGGRAGGCVGVCGCVFVCGCGCGCWGGGINLVEGGC
jgi:hypothetical protein